MKKRGFVSIPVILALLLCLAGCACSWEPLAPPETRLNVATCLDARVYEPLIQEFQEQTGIWVEIFSGDARWLRKNAKDYDVVLGLPSALAEACGENLQILPQIQQSLVPQAPVSERWVSISLRPGVVIYNPRVIRQNFPEGARSLTESPWKGLTAIPDPECAPWVLSYFANEQETSFRALAENQVFLCNSDEEAAKLVAEGSRCLGLVTEDAARWQLSQGGDLTLVYQQENIYLVADTAALGAECKNPENAQVFLNFLLEENTQLWLRDSCFRGSVLPSLAEELPDAQVSRENLLPYWQEAAA